MISRLSCPIAKTRWGSAVLAWLLAHPSTLLPIRRVTETPATIAFHHPRPAYPFHLRVPPKKPIRPLPEIQGGEQEIFGDVLRTRQRCISHYEPDQSSCRVILHGGGFQDVPLLPFHLRGGNDA